MADRFSGRVVLITGAASGFGRAAACRFAAEGARLVLTDLSPDVAEVAAEFDAISALGDIAEEATSEKIVARALDRYGRLDIAINNAGIGHEMLPITELSVTAFDQVMAVNARGVFLGMKHQLPPMIAAGSGAIVNVASAAGLVGAGQLSSYAASKHAVVGLTRSAADEVARHGIRVNALCPSFAWTPLFDEMADSVAERRGGSRADAGARIAGRIPMRRVAEPDEVVQAMLWLADPKNSFTTGQAIAIDGGLTAV